VSEGQFAEVCAREVQAIRGEHSPMIVIVGDQFPIIIPDAFAALEMPQPKLTFMVVGKRHHVRFFPAGLVVDTDVAHPYE